MDIAKQLNGQDDLLKTALGTLVDRMQQSGLNIEKTYNSHVFTGEIIGNRGEVSIHTRIGNHYVVITATMDDEVTNLRITACSPCSQWIMRHLSPNIDFDDFLENVQSILDELQERDRLTEEVFRSMFPNNERNIIAKNSVRRLLQKRREVVMAMFNNHFKQLEFEF